MADNRPTAYEEPPNMIYRASGAGDCVRYLVASALGYEDQRNRDHQALMDRSAEEGNLHEEAVVKKMEEEGWDVYGQQDEINVQVIPGVFLRGHREGLRSQNDIEQLFEIKSMSTKQFTKWQNHGFESFERYAWQISIYMKAHPGLDVEYIVKRREDGYVSTRTIPADNPPVPFSVIRKKIVIAEKYRRKGQLPPCDVQNQWGCPVWYLHDEDETEEEAQELTEAEKEILAELVMDYRRLKAIEEKGKEAEAARKQINPQILNMLGKLDQTEFKWDGHKYRVTRRRGGGKKWDQDKLIELIGEDRLDEFKSSYRFQYPIITEIE